MPMQKQKAKSLRDCGGDSNIMEVVGGAVDITEKKHLEQQLQVYKQVLENCPGNIYWKNMQGVYLGRNQFAAETMCALGLLGDDAPGAIIGKTDFDLFDAKTAEQHACIDQEVMQGKRTMRVEEITKGLNNQDIHFLSTKRPLYDANDKVMGVLCNSVDITEQKQLEAELKRALEAKDHFYKKALQVAHDIRSPAAALEILAKDLSQLPEAQRVLMREAVVQINDIANNLLTEYKAKLNEDEVAPQLLSAAVLSLLSEKRLQFAKQAVHLEADISQEGHFAFVSLRLTELKRVLSNLINNAVEASKGLSEKIWIKLTVQGSMVQLSVKDRGCGMSESLVAKVGQMGLTQHKSGGMGLGVYHAKQFVESVDGRLVLQSREGEGTQVFLELPLAKIPDYFATAIDIRPNQLLVILDDDEAIHRAWDQRFANLVESQLIHHFYTPAECLSFIRSQQQELLLLTDYELSGYQETGLDIIKQSGGQNTILVTSYYESAEIQKQCLELQAKLLPKSLASEVEVRVAATVKPIDAVVLEDQEYSLNSMRYLAGQQNKQLLFCQNFKALAPLLKTIPKQTPFYLDQDLGAGEMTGLEIAKYLFDMGYTELYLTTGLLDFDLQEHPYVKGAVDKGEVV